jgi:predicted transcriptional regulator
MKTKFEQSIEDVLDLPDSPPLASIPSMATKPIIKEKEPEVNGDYQYARENLYKVIESGHDALDNMLAIAKSSEHPRAFEVVNQIMKTMADAQKDLLELKKKEQQITGEKAQPQNVTNALFVGSTAELQKMIKER